MCGVVIELSPCERCDRASVKTLVVRCEADCWSKERRPRLGAWPAQQCDALDAVTCLWGEAGRMSGCFRAQSCLNMCVAMRPQRHPDLHEEVRQEDCVLAPLGRDPEAGQGAGLEHRLLHPARGLSCLSLQGNMLASVFRARSHPVASEHSLASVVMQRSPPT